ncbi:GntR family transcriptional regulator [Spirochaeta dissipatitropha]
MAQSLDNEIPLFLQIKQKIEDMIVSGSLKAGDQVPSSTQMVKFYQVNHLTVLKGINMLVDEQILFKKRGVGMFVAEDASDKLHQRRRSLLVRDFVQPLLREARHLGIKLDELTTIIAQSAQEDQHE